MLVSFLFELRKSQNEIVIETLFIAVRRPSQATRTVPDRRPNPAVKLSHRFAVVSNSSWNWNNWNWNWNWNRAGIRHNPPRCLPIATF